MFCLSHLDWTDLEKSWCQLCLQTHWRTCRGKRRRPQDCSSLRGSSPSSCKLLMELMISACISLIATHTISVNREGKGEKRGNRRRERGDKGEKWKMPQKEKWRETNKQKKSKEGSDWTEWLGHLQRKGTKDKKHTLQNSWGSDIKRRFHIQNYFSHCSYIRKPQDTVDHPTMLPSPF